MMIGNAVSPCVSSLVFQNTPASIFGTDYIIDYNPGVAANYTITGSGVSNVKNMVSPGTGDFQQTVDARRPLIAAADINGFNAISIDTTAKCLVGDTFGTPFGSNLYMAMMIKIVSSSNTFYTISMTTGANAFFAADPNGGFAVADTNPLGNYLLFTGSTQGSSGRAYTTGVYQLVQAWYDGANISLQIGNGSVGTVASTRVLNPNRMLLGTDSSAPSVFPVRANYARIIGCKTASTLAQRNAMISYMQATYGVV